MYIPEEGVHFQLVGYLTNARIYSRDGPVPVVYDTHGEVLDDQWFTLLYGAPEEGRERLYALETRATPKVLYSSATANPAVGNNWLDHANGDKYVEFLLQYEGSKFISVLQLVHVRRRGRETCERVPDPVPSKFACFVFSHRFPTVW